MPDSYAEAGVNTKEADEAVSGLVEVLQSIRTSATAKSVVAPGHYASVLQVAPDLGIALSTDGVGSKVIIAEQLRRFDTVGIDLIAMNANDVLCVGAKPLALLDYIAVEHANPAMLSAIGEGLKAGAEQADIDIPGGELAQLPELIRGHPSPLGFDLSGTCVGTVAISRLVTGRNCQPTDVVLGIPSSGVHANGLTLARKALLDNGAFGITDQPPLLARSIGEELLTPTEIYVRAIMDLLEQEVPVHGLVHITSDGLSNLCRLETPFGFEIEDPLPVPPIFDLIAAYGDIPVDQMHRVFNMGCGFCVVVPSLAQQEAIAILQDRFPGARRIGEVRSGDRDVSVPSLNLRGDRRGLWLTQDEVDHADTPVARAVLDSDSLTF